MSVSIDGEHFYAQAHRRLGQGTLVDSQFHARLGGTDGGVDGGVELENLRWVSATELTARVPPVVPPGTYALTVVAPNGTAMLPDAFVVLPIEHCDTGVDEDRDGLIDCDDPDCEGKPCQDGDACTEFDVCKAGQCRGQPMQCTPLSSCFVGGCDAGACGFSVVPGGSCSDGDPCTAADVCLADGGCAGTPTCVAPGECWSAQCAPDGGCLLTVNTGQPCSTGTCGSDGTCVASGWSYAPSNFDPGGLSPSGSAVFSGCNAVFSTTTDTFVVGCPGVQPAVSTVTLSDGRPATVLAFQNLTVDANASLTFTGQKPAIVAIFGDGMINGRVLANSTAAQPGAGSNGTTCGARAGGDSQTNRSGGGGAGHRTDGAVGGSGFALTGGAAGTADPSPGAVPLRGGCPGGASGLLTATNAGRGGGALQLSASGSLVISGVLSVSAGGGGGGEGNNYGGYGGGSGGTLVLEGDSIDLTATARLTANGGAGGGGSGTGGSRGGWGSDGATDTSVGAPGGTAGNATAGAGGAGAAGALLPSAGGSSSSDGAGGGGGSAGAIFVRASPGKCIGAASVVSPPASFSTSCP
ncbi:MAG TPA: hypothetical protein VE782_13870 [Myxococcaceae bacterium]|nr:hypothetical protein [Myxococcaceae bacterium]